MGTVAGTPTTIDVFTRRALSDPPARTGTYVGRGEFYSGIATGDRVFVRDGNIATGRVTVQSMDAGAHLFVDVDDLDDVRPASCLERDRYAVAVLEGVVRRHYPAATAWERNEAGRVARRLAADVCAPTDLRDRIRRVIDVLDTAIDAVDVTRMCDTCGEAVTGAAAEVVRDGRHVIVHADTCLRDGEEVA